MTVMHLYQMAHQQMPGILSSPAHAPASALLSDWTMRTVHQQNILVVMTTHGQLNFSPICPSWKFYFLRHHSLTLKILSLGGGGGFYLTSRHSRQLGIFSKSLCNLLTQMPEHWKKIMLNARYLLPKNLGITDQQRLKMVNSQDALLFA